MKKWTMNFLSKKPDGIPSPESAEKNGRLAAERIKFPYELWMELSRYDVPWEDMDPLTLFAAGLAIGWAEHEESVE